MQQDFYLDERWLASYFEKDWFDHVLRGHSNIDNKFYYSKFDPNYLYSDYHEKLVDFVTNEISKIPASPISYLEIGSSLGRTFYELCVKQKSIRTATLIEPSENLASCFLKIFGTQDSAEFPILKGNMNLDKVLFNSNHIRIAASNVDYSLINKPFQDAVDLKPAELVVCSNVIDQCQDPLALVELVKSLVAPAVLPRFCESEILSQVALAC